MLELNIGELRTQLLYTKQVWKDLDIIGGPFTLNLVDQQIKISYDKKFLDEHIDHHSNPEDT